MVNSNKHGCFGGLLSLSVFWFGVVWFGPIFFMNIGWLVGMTKILLVCIGVINLYSPFFFFFNEDAWWALLGIQHNIISLCVGNRPAPIIRKERPLNCFSVDSGMSPLASPCWGLANFTTLSMSWAFQESGLWGPNTEAPTQKPRPWQLTQFTDAKTYDPITSGREQKPREEDEMKRKVPAAPLNAHHLESTSLFTGKTCLGDSGRVLFLCFLF